MIGNILRDTALTIVILLFALPPVAAATEVFRTPFQPPDLDLRDGAVGVSIALYRDGQVQTESFLIQPDALPVSCGETLPRPKT